MVLGSRGRVRRCRQGAGVRCEGFMVRFKEFVGYNDLYMVKAERQETENKRWIVCSRRAVTS